MQRNNKNEQKIEFWFNHVEHSKKFDGSVLEYCRSNNIAPQTFYKWRAKFANKLAAVPVAAKQSKPFIPIQIEPITTSGFSTMPDAKWVAELILHLQGGLL